MPLSFFVSRDKRVDVARWGTPGLASKYVDVSYLVSAATASVSVARKGLFVICRDLTITFFFFKILEFSNIVNPLYNDICYNSKIRYNGNLVCTKIS